MQPGGQQTTGQPGGQQAGTGSGLSVIFDYTTTFRYDDNLGLNNPSLGSTTRWENRFGLGVVSQTPDSLLSFDLSGLHRYSDRPTFGSNSEFADPSARLAYTRNSANSRVSGLAEYREIDLTFNRALTDLNQDGVIDAGDIVVDNGTRVDTRADLTWQTGINDPLGFLFDYSRRERDYQNTTDLSLFDNQTDRYSLTALLRISPVLQGDVRVDYTEYSAADIPLTDRQTTTITTGATYNVSPVTTISGRIGATRVEETLRAVPLSTDDEGFVASLSWTKILPNGTVNAQIDQSFGRNGDRTTAQAGRSFTLPTGTFGFNLGITEGPAGETTAIGDVNYTHRLSTSQITALLRRRVATSTQSRETRETLARLGYDYFINSLSRASFGVNYVEQESEGIGLSNRRQRANFNASYTRALTQDWNMTVGYEYRINDNSNSVSGSASGNSVFVTLGRQFVLKP